MDFKIVAAEIKRLAYKAQVHRNEAHKYNQRALNLKAKYDAAQRAEFYLNRLTPAEQTALLKKLLG